MQVPCRHGRVWVVANTIIAERPVGGERCHLHESARRLARLWALGEEWAGAWPVESDASAAYGEAREAQQGAGPGQNRVALGRAKAGGRSLDICHSSGVDLDHAEATGLLLGAPRKWPDLRLLARQSRPNGTTHHGTAWDKAGGRGHDVPHRSNRLERGPPTL